MPNDQIQNIENIDLANPYTIWIVLFSWPLWIMEIKEANDMVDQHIQPKPMTMIEHQHQLIRYGVKYPLPLIIMEWRWMVEYDHVWIVIGMARIMPT